jgi:hypothetical protein
MTELTAMRLRKLMRRTLSLLVFVYLAAGVAATLVTLP